jgi:hypothetical protein
MSSLLLVKEAKEQVGNMQNSSTGCQELNAKSGKPQLSSVGNAVGFGHCGAGDGIGLLCTVTLDRGAGAGNKKSRAGVNVSSVQRRKFFRTYKNIQLRVEEMIPGIWEASVHDGRLYELNEITYAPKEPWRKSIFAEEEKAKTWATFEAAGKVGYPTDDEFTQWRDQSDMSDEEWKRITELDPNEEPIFSVRAFLKIHQTLLVHFNTPMSVNHPTCFPEDLRDAQALRGIPLSFSTIGVNDSQVNADGSVGLVVDIQETGSVISVGAGDDGTRANAFGEGAHQTGGKLPSEFECAKSIGARRGSSNEWFVQNFTPLGIFVFAPLLVFVRRGSEQGERPSTLTEVLSAYPNQRVFTIQAGAFQEFGRKRQKWLPVAYGDIVPL